MITACHPTWGTLPLLSVTVFLLVLGCSKGPTQAQAPDASASPSDGGLVLRGLGVRRELELLPFKDGRLLELIGERDETNRYASTVEIEGEPPMRPEGCSGVLIHPRLVLTAAHCACDWRIENPACANRVQVTALLHEPSAESHKPTIIWQVQEGTIRIHPDFKLHRGATAEVSTSHADLAVILLDKPITLDVPKVHLSATPAQVGESVVTVSFGNEPGLARTHGARYFRQGRITQVLPAQDGRTLYEPAGAYLNTSYRGGPCFLERGKSRWLVGIVGLGTDEEMSFTSIDSHLNWLSAELEHAAAAGSPVPPAP